MSGQCSLYLCEPILVLEEQQLRSSEGAQQGDPLGPLEFCEAIHPLLTNLQSTVKIGFMDDITLAGDIRTVEAHVNTLSTMMLTLVSISTPASVKSLQKHSSHP